MMYEIQETQNPKQKAWPNMVSWIPIGYQLYPNGVLGFLKPVNTNKAWLAECNLLSSIPLCCTSSIIGLLCIYSPVLPVSFVVVSVELPSVFPVFPVFPVLPLHLCVYWHLIAGFDLGIVGTVCIKFGIYLCNRNGVQLILLQILTSR